MKENISVIIADENKELVSSIKQIIQENSKIKRVETCFNGEETLEKIINIKPDVVVLDAILSGIDGFEVIEETKKQGVDTKFIFLTSLTSDTFVQKAMNLGAGYYMIKPVSSELILKRILEVAELNSGEVKNNQVEEVSKINKNRAMEEKITNIFITVGIPAHIKGYHFLREAIKMAIENPEIINSITKQLYPSIAERFSTSASKVERAIRHAIEVAWNRGKIENINSVFGIKVYSNNEKPTNGEFIALVADKMLIEG